MQDVFSNKVVGYSIDSHMKPGLVVSALNNTVARVARSRMRGSQRPPIAVSLAEVTRESARRRMIGSIARVGAAGGNAAMEGFFSLL